MITAYPLTPKLFSWHLSSIQKPTTYIHAFWISLLLGGLIVSSHPAHRLIPTTHWSLFVDAGLSTLFLSLAPCFGLQAWLSTLRILAGLPLKPHPVIAPIVIESSEISSSQALVDELPEPTPNQNNEQLTLLDNQLILKNQRKKTELYLMSMFLMLAVWIALYAKLAAIWLLIAITSGWEFLSKACLLPAFSAIIGCSAVGLTLFYQMTQETARR